jgi:hypothetical protein
MSGREAEALFRRRLFIEYEKSSNASVQELVVGCDDSRLKWNIGASSILDLIVVI